MTKLLKLNLKMINLNCITEYLVNMLMLQTSENYSF